MSINVQPDLDFIRDMKKAGGDTLKKCFQCATCSVACPLSTDGDPFPRREMIYAQWGLKEKLIGDANVLLCHQCGDCSTNCPRGARPADVLGAIRAYAYTFYGWPGFLAKRTTAVKHLPVLIGIPAAIILIVWAFSGGMNIPSDAAFQRYGYTRFFGHWDFRWLAKNVLTIQMMFVPTAALAFYASYRGVTAMWKAMAKNAGIVEPLYRPSAYQFVTEFFWPSVVEIVKHKRFKKCKTNTARLKGHYPLMLAFMALFFVTCFTLFKQDVLGIWMPEMHGPMSMWNPVKILANVAAVAMIVGTWIMCKNRWDMEKAGETSRTFYDWFLLGMIMAVAVTGMAAQNLRLLDMITLGYIIYYLHLVSVMMLFAYMPYTKFAHLVYRTFAMAFERYRESAYVKDPLKGE